MHTRHFVRGRDDAKREAVRIAARQRNVSRAARENPKALIAYLRTTYDSTFLEQKRALWVDKKTASHVIIASPVAEVDPGTNLVACAFVVATREELRAKFAELRAKFAADAEAHPKVAEVAAQLAEPPLGGSAWLLCSIPGTVLLWQEAVDHSANTG